MCQFVAGLASAYGFGVAFVVTCNTDDPALPETPELAEQTTGRTGMIWTIYWSFILQAKTYGKIHSQIAHTRPV